MIGANPPGAYPIPDHELLRRIGTGSYGEVWLARNVVGTYRAIKIITRKRFPGDRPFDREFMGIKKFEPLSRTHAGFVSVLHIGLNREAGYFYYVMEVADDEHKDQSFGLDEYSPKTLGGELARLGKLPAHECVQIALVLTDALGHLHRNGLVHRDIKPSNIIFVNQCPKLADIGLVADISESATFVGTEGYVPPEGPGKPTADLYGLGKVLYQISLGQNLQDFPELPSNFDKQDDAGQLKKLYQVILKACDLNVRRRFQSAQEMCDQLKDVLGANKRIFSPSGGTVRLQAAQAAPLQVAVLCQQNAQPDERLLQLLTERLALPRRRPSWRRSGAPSPWTRSFILSGGRMRNSSWRLPGATALCWSKAPGRWAKPRCWRGVWKKRGSSAARWSSRIFKPSTRPILESLEKFYLALSESLASQLDLKVFPQEVWNSQRSPNTNLERYLQREVLEKLPSPMVWGLDEVDRLFTCSFGTEVFGLFRSWHNKRALDPHSPWAKLTLAIAYATEAHLFITDMNQSPFNVGTRLALQDFSPAEVRELNRRYGSPLRDDGLDKFIALLGGQPYLVRRGLNELVAEKIRADELKGQADLNEGIFGDHLRRLLISLAKDAELIEVVRGVLAGRSCPTKESFYRLRSAGVIVGDSPDEARPRCQLYAAYLSKHLL